LDAAPYEIDGTCEHEVRGDENCGELSVERADVRLLQWSGHVDDETIPDYVPEPVIPDDHPDLAGMPAWGDYSDSEDEQDEGGECETVMSGDNCSTPGSSWKELGPNREGQHGPTDEPIGEGDSYGALEPRTEAVAVPKAECSSEPIAQQDPVDMNGVESVAQARAHPSVGVLLGGKSAAWVAKWGAR
jgi:hypothetical protein